nr:hypothetical protein [Tanacetum cinerariifolium]
VANYDVAKMAEDAARYVKHVAMGSVSHKAIMVAEKRESELKRGIKKLAT